MKYFFLISVFLLPVISSSMGIKCHFEDDRRTVLESEGIRNAYLFVNAIRNSKTEEAKLLLSKKIDINNSFCYTNSFREALLHGSDEIVWMLLSREDLDLNLYKSPNSYKDSYLRTAVSRYFASYSNLSREQRVEKIRKDRTANLEIIKTLLKKVPDYVGQTKYGYDALSSALAHENYHFKNQGFDLVSLGLDVSSYLVSQGVSIKSKDYWGHNLWYHAVHFNGSYAKRLITLGGGDFINETDNDGRTLLHHMTLKGKFGVHYRVNKVDIDVAEYINFLIALGADISIRDNDGKLPLDYALENRSYKDLEQFEEVNKLLLSKTVEAEQASL